MNKSHVSMPPHRSLLAVAALLACTGVQAIEFETDNPDMKIRWDNTVKYSAAARVKARSAGLSSTVIGPMGIVGPNNLNQNDGNNNFGRGLVSSRLDLLSEFDASYRNFGARVSAATWYDSEYRGSTGNSTTSSNHIPASEFPAETSKLMGSHAEVLDAFVYGKFELGEANATVRAGRHTLLWGESLFFGANGIAGGQAPLDLPKLLSVPNSQFKEIARPTGKVSGQVQLSKDVTLGAYVNYEWKPTRLMPVGAYLSASDTLGPGAERIYAGPAGTFLAGKDIEPSAGGQGGIQMRWRLDSIDTDFGFYATRYHATTPSNIYNTLSGFPPALSAQSFRWAYHEGVRAYGASFAKTIGDWGLAGEVSMRKNAPLASSSQTVIPSIGVGTQFDNDNNPGYAVGETAHAQVSWIASLGPSLLYREASFIGEVAWNKRMKVTRNSQMLNPNADKTATGMRMVFAPTYRQVASGLDLTPSVGVGYTWGKSSAVGPGFGVDKGGDFNIGLSGVYLGTWAAAINYVRYLGPEGSTLDNFNNAQFKQALKDRNFVSVSLRTTF